MTDITDAHAEIARLQAEIDRLRGEIERLRAMVFNPVTLTDEEREAVAWAIGACEREQTTASDAADRGYKLPDTREWAEKHGKRADTLRGLLERLGGGDD